MESSDQQKVTETVEAVFNEFPTTLKAQWRAMGGLTSAQISVRVNQNYESAPMERREILTVYLAQKLGFSWLLNSRSRLTSEPLWLVLQKEKFDELSDDDRDILMMVARSTPKRSNALHPKAALAAVAIWRFDDERRADAAELISERGFGSNLKWLYTLVSLLMKSDRELEVNHNYRLKGLIELHYNAELHDIAALMCGFYLVRRYDAWRIGGIRTNLIDACDIASNDHAREERWFLDMVADCSVKGVLKSSWMERPMMASITIEDDPLRLQTLKAYNNLRLWESYPSRLKTLYSKYLDQLHPVMDPTAMGSLLYEIDLASTANPTRAIRILEMTVESSYNRALDDVLRHTPELNPLLLRLARLYVRTLELSDHAVGFVGRFQKELGLEPLEIQQFLAVGEYRETFAGMDVAFSGIEVSHLDKDAAARIRYFEKSRENPNSFTKTLTRIQAPRGWALTHLAGSESVESGFDQLFDTFKKRIIEFDFTDEVMRGYRRANVDIKSFDEIADLPVFLVERAARDLKLPRLLVGASSGFVSGAVGPASYGASAILDIPILTLIVAEACARYCWFYGFDPRDHDDLVTTILSVALQGANPERRQRTEVRQDLRRLILYRAVFLGAVANGAFHQLVGPTLQLLVKALGGGNDLPILSAIVKRKTEETVLKRATTYIRPALTGAVASAVNTSIVYDICESAQVVLTDRFLERKYPQWERQF